MSRDNKKIGAELSQLARFLFDEAAENWYLSLLIQTLTGVSGIIISLFNIPDSWKLFLALITFAALAWAYILRIRFDEKYDRAETMRRQAALSEGLDLPVSRIQVSEWRRRVSSHILNRFDAEKRDEDYYASQTETSAKRLLEMTMESAFYTRHLYTKIRSLIWLLLFTALVLSFSVLSLLPFGFVEKTLATKAAYTLYLVLPLLLSVDLLFWGMKLNRMINSICDIEKDMEKLSEESDLDPAHVIRLVSEYNCQVTSGIPIHNFLFKIWHNEIRGQWEKHQADAA